MEGIQNLDNILRREQFLIISDLPGDQLKIKRYLVNFALKNLPSVTLHFSHVLEKSGKIQFGNITLEDLISIQNQKQITIKELNAYALTTKNFSLAQVKTAMIERDENEALRKVGSFEALNRLKSKSTIVSNKGAISKSKQGSKKQIAQAEPSLPKIKQSIEKNEIKTFLNKTMSAESKEIKNPPKKVRSHDEKLLIKYSTSDEEGGEFEEEPHKMDIEEKVQKIEAEEDDDAFEKLLVKNKKEPPQKKIDENITLKSSGEKKPPNKVQKPSANVPHGNRSLFDFIKKKS